MIQNVAKNLLNLLVYDTEKFSRLKPFIERLDKKSRCMFLMGELPIEDVPFEINVLLKPVYKLLQKKLKNLSYLTSLYIDKSDQYYVLKDIMTSHLNVIALRASSNEEDIRSKISQITFLEEGHREFLMSCQTEPLDF